MPVRIPGAARARARAASRRGWLACIAVCALATSAAHAADPAVAEPGADGGATQYVLTAWTADKGLPAGDVWAMAQGAGGFLWLGTDAGLVRFDGFQFTQWGTHGEPPLAGKSIRSLLTSRDGSLWVAFGDVGGVDRIRNSRVLSYPEGDGLARGATTALLEDKAGTIWAASRGGLSAYRDGRWQPAGAGLPEAEVYSIYQDGKGTLWAGTSAGVFSRDTDQAPFERIDDSLTFVQSFAEDGAGTVWAADTQQIIRSVNATVRPDRAPDVRLPTPGWRLARTHGEVWVAALGGGLLRMREPGPRGRPLIERVSYENTLTGSPRSLFQDADRNIWVGMRGGGLLRLSEAVVRTEIRLDGLTNDGVRALAADQDGRVWVATGHSLNVFSRGQQTAYDMAQTMALHTDAKGQLWAVTHDGIGRIVDGRFRPLPLPRPLRFERVTSLTSDTSGALWLCSIDEGVLRFDGAGLAEFKDVPDVAGRPCNSAYGDSTGRVWLGFARGGVSVYENGRFTAFSGRDGLATGGVMAIYEDRRGAIWISTASGLSRFENGRFTTMTDQNGLPGSVVPSIIEDSEGYFWVGVNSGAGLIRFSRREVDRVAVDPAYQIQYALYDMSDGLRGILHWRSHPSAVQSADGNLWFVTGTGVAVVDPRTLPARRRQSTPRVERVVANGQSYATGGRIVLPSDTSTLQIEYTALGLSAASKFRFRYMLEGLSTDWVDAGSRRVASYTNLPPGQYRFRVSATTDGAWNDAQSVLEFSVRAPFYQTMSFYSAAAVAVALLLWAYWRSRMAAARRQFALVLDERTRMSREIHDTLLQDLGAFGLELEVVAGQFDATHDQASDSLRRLRQQVGRCVREARQSIWELRSPRFDARGLVAGFRGLARAVQAQAGVEVAVSAQGDARRCSQEVEEQLLRIGQEALNNAVRHGQATRIDIVIDYRHDAVSVRISDDGVGFVTEAQTVQNGHWGLVNMKERAASIRAQFAISSDLGQGTIVEAIAPVAGRD